MTLKARLLFPGFVIGAALALSLQAQATTLHPEPSSDQGHGAAQAEGASGLRNLAAATPDAQPAAQPEAPAHGDGHWTYDGDTGPAHWGNVSEDYGVCKTGESQSPIDLNGGIPAETLPIEFDYAVTPLRLENNGHTVVAHYAPGSGITIEGQRFELLQFHFHAPSEHKINGKPAVMEVHFVHRNRQGQLAVVGVLVEQGAENMALAEIWNHLPSHAGPAQDFDGVLINGRDLLPGKRAYYRYMGSLTTPPCSEGVNWFLMVAPIQASLSQVLHFAAPIGSNNRPIQSGNGRLVLVPSSHN
jgi:carbonic anhydrase